jgi:hypothetical protein
MPHYNYSNNTNFSIIMPHVSMSDDSMSLQITAETTPVSVIDTEITWNIDRSTDYSYLIHEPTPNCVIKTIFEPFDISNEDLVCCICFELREKQDICSLNCSHKFCGTCIETSLKMPIKYNCALCRQQVTSIKTQTVENKNKLSF